MAEVDPGTALVDRRLPVVVDDELSAMEDADIPRFPDLAADLVGGLVFQAQLDQPRADRHEALHPAHVGDDGIEGIEHVRGLPVLPCRSPASTAGPCRAAPAAG